MKYSEIQIAMMTNAERTKLIVKYERVFAQKSEANPFFYKTSEASTIRYIIAICERYTNRNQSRGAIPTFTNGDKMYQVLRTFNDGRFDIEMYDNLEEAEEQYYVWLRCGRGIESMVSVSLIYINYNYRMGKVKKGWIRRSQSKGRNPLKPLLYIPFGRGRQGFKSRFPENCFQKQIRWAM